MREHLYDQPLLSLPHILSRSLKCDSHLNGMLRRGPASPTVVVNLLFQTVWPYPCPRPTFKTSWLYRTTSMASLHSVAMQLRIIWMCIRWDDMNTKPPIPNAEGKHQVCKMKFIEVCFFRHHITYLLGNKHSHRWTFNSALIENQLNPKKNILHVQIIEATIINATTIFPGDDRQWNCDNRDSATQKPRQVPPAHPVLSEEGRHSPQRAAKADWLLSYQVGCTTDDGLNEQAHCQYRMIVQKWPGMRKNGLKIEWKHVES